MYLSNRVSGITFYDFIDRTVFIGRLCNPALYIIIPIQKIPLLVFLNIKNNIILYYYVFCIYNFLNPYYNLKIIYIIHNMMYIIL